MRYHSIALRCWMIAHWPPVNERSPGMGNMRLVRLPVNIYKAAASYFSCYTWFKLQINISNTLTGPFKNPKDGERCRNTATNNVVIMKNLSKLVDKIYTSAERHIYLVTGSCNCWMSSGGFRHFAICCSLAVFRPSSTSLYFAVLSYKKHVVIQLETTYPLLGPAATTIIQIQVIAI